MRKLKKGMGLKSTDNIPIGIQPRDKYLTGNVLFLLVKSSEVTQQKKLCNFSFVIFFFRGMFTNLIKAVIFDCCM